MPEMAGSKARAPDLSVVISAHDEESAIGETLDRVAEYLRTTGLSHEIIVVDDGSADATAEVARLRAASARAIRVISLEKQEGRGAAVRRGVMESRGEVIASIDADHPYEMQNLGNAVALVQSAGADIAIGARDLPSSGDDRSDAPSRGVMDRILSLFVRAMLVRGIPDPRCGMKVFSANAAHLIFSESKLRGLGVDLEVLFLARKYGLRIERLPVSIARKTKSEMPRFEESIGMIVDVFRVRYWNRVQAYRSPRRCPVCFSTEVFTRSQLQGWVVRHCSRCKCRYLGSFPSEDEIETLYNAEYFSSGRDTEYGTPNRDLTPAVRRTNERRLAILRRHLPSQARLLEVGAGNAHFGRLASRELEYVGIDLSDEAAREARREGLHVVRASLCHFVNTGAPFDAVTLFHVFEHLMDPHDALATISELLKPGGILVLITPDTESLLCAISGDRWEAYKFPDHLILYSRSALIELLEHSGFEIVSVSSDFEYCDHSLLLSRISRLSRVTATLAKPILALLPDPIPASSGSIRIVARRRSGPSLSVRAIRAVEPTHAR